MPKSRTISPKRFAEEYAGVSVSMVYKQIHEGKIPASKLGSVYRIPVEFAEGWLKGKGVTDVTPA